ncbi:carbohydrate ABC transporter permease [Pseudofrankia sp. DC12]|uniref:carbohydrate ABC transporter permease n=1 Tax=Pseudofrankia sp. DC12 TaxID=683315 RepID=UPI00069804EB|nr:carbohydrate ABC transporter permease [Pseudofrankia sp. DC12]
MFIELAAPAALAGAGRAATAVSQPVAARPAPARRLLAAAPPYKEHQMSVLSADAGAADEAGLAGPPKARLAWAGAAGRHAVIVVLSLLSIVPIYWMYASSLRRPGDILSQNPLPWPLSLRNYDYVLHSLEVPVLLANTLVIAAASTVGQLLVCLLAAYAFAAWDFRGKNVLFLLFVVTWLVPFQVCRGRTR